MPDLPPPAWALYATLLGLFTVAVFYAQRMRARHRLRSLLPPAIGGFLLARVGSELEIPYALTLLLMVPSIFVAIWWWSRTAPAAQTDPLDR